MTLRLACTHTGLNNVNQNKSRFCTSSSVLQKETLLGRHLDVELEDVGK